MRTLALVMAGGQGTRLHPLTRDRAKPAVPFGGKYRIIDFVLSNLVNSEIYSIYVLVQWRSQSLIEHLKDGWQFGGLLPTHFVTPVPAQMRRARPGIRAPRTPSSRTSTCWTTPNPNWSRYSAPTTSTGWTSSR